jgi:hypothetical protein
LPSHSLPFSRQTNRFAGGLASFYLYCLFQHQRCALLVRHNIKYCSFTPTLGKVDSTSSKGASRSPPALDFSSSARCSGWSTRITSLDSKLEVSRIHLWILLRLRVLVVQQTQHLRYHRRVSLPEERIAASPLATINRTEDRAQSVRADMQA